jgi:hypothetical protein
VQRREVLIAIMLARERRAPADAAADGCTALAAALATLPSRPLELVADAVAALGIQFDVQKLEALKGELQELTEENRRILYESSVGDSEDRLQDMTLKLTSKQAEIAACLGELKTAREKLQIQAERQALITEISQLEQAKEEMKAEFERLKTEILSATTVDVEKQQRMTDLLRGWKLKECEFTKLKLKLGASV